MSSVLVRGLFCFQLLCFCPFIASAELYKCGELWSTTPCGDGSGAVTDLPPVRGTEKQSTGIIPDYEPSIRITDLCSDKGKGKLVVERVVVNAEAGNYILDLSVRNKARTNFSGVIYAFIKDTQRDIAMVKKVARYIPFNASDLFSVSLGAFAPRWYYGPKLEVQLLYESASCVSRSVVLPPVSQRKRKRMKLSDPLTNGEGSLLLSGLNDEHDEVYAALPIKGGAISAYNLRTLHFKLEQLLRRAGVFCKRIKDNSLLYRCGVIDQRLRGTVQHIKKLEGSLEDSSKKP